MSHAGCLGAFLIALSVAVFFVNAIVSLRSRIAAPADPWDAATLEWTVSSPPPEYNFAQVPSVNSARPFWLFKYGPTRAASQHVRGEGTPPQPDEPTARIDLPSPSWWPPIAAFGLTLAAGGAMVGLPVTLLGVAILVVGVYAWALQPLERPGHPSFGPAGPAQRDAEAV